MARDDHAQPVRVLVVEDDPRVRGALRAFLSASPGLDVVGDAGDPAAALRLAQEQAPTVALVDVLLPEAADGIGLLRALTGELGIPAVAISIQGGLRGAALAAGAYRFLDKDRPPELLIAALRAAGGREPGKDLRTTR